MIIFERRSLDAIPSRELFDLLRLRVDVFVVEQDCAYPELDDADASPHTRHVQGRENGALVACARTLPPRVPDGGTPHECAARIGRVAVRASHRGHGVAQALMVWTLAALAQDYPNRPVILGAQIVVEGFYESLGFTRVSAEYVEDGIAHVDMIRETHRAEGR